MFILKCTKDDVSIEIPVSIMLVHLALKQWIVDDGYRVGWRTRLGCRMFWSQVLQVVLVEGDGELWQAIVELREKLEHVCFRLTTINRHEILCVVTF